MATYRCPPGYPCEVEALAWSPDGTRLAYLAGGVSIPSPDIYALYVVGADGQHPRLLTACGDCNGVSWSPDSSQIAVTRYSGPAVSRFATPRGSWNLWVVNARTGALRQVADCPSLKVCSLPTDGEGPQNAWWSPDGRAILFSLGRKGNPQLSLDTIRPDGSDLTKIATFSGSYAAAQWSPDGREVAFDDNNGIYIVNADGTGLRRLVARGGDPAWSPDGARLIYSTPPPEAGATRLWMINANGSDRRLVYRYPVGHSNVGGQIWSPDGKQIAFTTVATTPPDSAEGTYVINANGTGLHRIGPWAIELAWQAIR